MAKVTLSGHIEVPEADIDDVIFELPNHISLTHQETGCIAFRVTQDLKKPCCFDVYEEFIDKAAFEKHQARVKTSKWGDVTKNTERFYKITEG